MIRFLSAVLIVLALFAVLALAGCGGERPAPEPIVRTVTVEIPVASPCAPDVGPPPAYPDTPELLAAAADLVERVARLLAGRELRQGREAVLEAALAECAAGGTPGP